MSPPVRRPLPRFIADASVEPLPYGRHAQRLRDAFAKACEKHVGEAGGPPGEVTWFPERAWGGRVYVPAVAPVEGASTPSEYFGCVSFVRPEDGEPSDFQGIADFTDVTAEDNPDWEIDLNEEVIGAWRGEGERRGEVTLVWGTPLIRGADAASSRARPSVQPSAPVWSMQPERPGFCARSPTAAADEGATRQTASAKPNSAPMPSSRARSVILASELVASPEAVARVGQT